MRSIAIIRKEKNLKEILCKRCQTTILEVEEHDCFINFYVKISKEFDNKLSQIELKLKEQLQNYYDNKFNDKIIQLELKLTEQMNKYNEN